MCRAAETTMEQTKIMTSKDEIHKVKVGGRPSGGQGKNPPKSMSSNAITAVDYTKNRNKNAQHTAKHALTAGKRIISQESVSRKRWKLKGNKLTVLRTTNPPQTKTNLPPMKSIALQCQLESRPNTTRTTPPAPSTRNDQRQRFSRRC